MSFLAALSDFQKKVYGRYSCICSLLFVVLMFIVLVLNTVNMWAARELL